MSEVTILRGCRGLNTRDHPSELLGKKGTYLSKAVNVDISDAGSVAVRCGLNSLVSGLDEPHSLGGVGLKFVVFVVGSSLYYADIEQEPCVPVLLTSVTADLPLSYTDCGEFTVYSNGVDRGCLSISNGVVIVTGYIPFVVDPSQEDRPITAFPVTNLIHFFTGSMYGAAKGETFCYCSEPYKINHYDNESGYLSLGSGINWINDVDSALLVGTDNGVTAFVGKGLGDFREERIIYSRSLVCSSEIMLLRDGVRSKGVIILCDDGIFFISVGLEIVDMTNKLQIDWSKINNGKICIVDNSYIFSGGIE